MAKNNVILILLVDPDVSKGFPGDFEIQWEGGSFLQ